MPGIRTAVRPLPALAFALALAASPVRAFASTDTPVDHGVRRLIAYMGCALSVFAAHDPLSTTTATATCWDLYRKEVA